MRWNDCQPNDEEHHQSIKINQQNELSLVTYGVVYHKYFLILDLNMSLLQSAGKQSIGNVFHRREAITKKGLPVTYLS